METNKIIKQLQDAWLDKYFNMPDRRELIFFIDRIEREFYEEELDKMNELSEQQKQEILNNL